MPQTKAQQAEFLRETFLSNLSRSFDAQQVQSVENGDGTLAQAKGDTGKAVRLLRDYQGPDGLVMEKGTVLFAVGDTLSPIPGNHFNATFHRIAADGTDAGLVGDLNIPNPDLDVTADQNHYQDHVAQFKMAIDGYAEMDLHDAVQTRNPDMLNEFADRAGARFARDHGVGMSPQFYAFETSLAERVAESLHKDDLLGQRLRETPDDVREQIMNIAAEKRADQLLGARDEEGALQGYRVTDRKSIDSFVNQVAGPETDDPVKKQFREALRKAATDRANQAEPEHGSVKTRDSGTIIKDGNGKVISASNAETGQENDFNNGQPDMAQMLARMIKNFLDKLLGNAPEAPKGP